MSSLGEIGEFSDTGRSGGAFSLDWRIPDFLSLGGEVGDFYSSPLFECCGGEWYLRAHPRGLWRNPLSECLSLFLCRADAGPPRTLGVAAGIRGSEGVKNRRARRQEFSIYDEACCWDGLCSRTELGERESGLVPGGVLAIAIDMEGDVDVVSEGGVKALEDFGKLLASGEKSDVTLQVGGVQFKAHSFVLFARSPALSVSLQHPSREKASNEIAIEDCDPEAFRHFLHYLYTGSVQSMENVFALHRIADKYLAEDLKQQCLEHVRDTLSVQTFCDCVKLALTYGESGLLQTAVHFATRNIRSIVCSVPWQHFIRECPTEANEIIIKSLGPP